MSKNYTITIEENEISICFTSKTISGIKEMDLDVYPIYGTILSLGKELLKLEHKEQFIILDEFQRLAIVGYKDCNTTAVDIVSVVHLSNVYIKNATKIFKYK